jgi:hypothetical protein
VEEIESPEVFFCKMHLLQQELHHQKFPEEAVEEVLSLNFSLDKDCSDSLQKAKELINDEISFYINILNNLLNKPINFFFNE